MVVLSGKEYPEELLGITTLKKPVIIDIGGNIGTFSLYTNKLNCNARIFAVEPVRENIKMFKKNIAVNNISDVVLIDSAVYNNNGSMSFCMDNSAYDGGRIIESQQNNSIEVSTITLATMLDKYKIKHVDLLKMDIEGGEYAVLEETYEILATKVDRIVIEYHKDIIKDGRDFIVDILTVKSNFNLIYESNNILGFQNSTVK